MTAHTFTATATELGQFHDLSARRIRQYAEDGLLPVVERGRFDAVFFMYLRIGERSTRNASKRRDRDTLVALGWLSGVGNEPSNDDAQAFANLFQRNGLSREQALMAIGRAQGLVRK